MPGFRLQQAITTRIRALRELCGENPASAFAVQFDALPVLRDASGWTAIRPDGAFVFVDDTTSRVTVGVPEEWRRRAVAELRKRYPEIGRLLE